MSAPRGFPELFVLLEIILCAEFSLLLFVPAGEISFPARAEVDVPSPEFA